MATVYFDSSALVKLLVEEDGSAVADRLWDGCSAALSSRLAYPEVRAALAAAGRGGRLGAQERSHAEQAWERLWSEVDVVELTARVASDAGSLAGRHGLRGADAVHLASLLALDDADVVFAVWDTRLREGAAAAGVRLAPAGR